MSRHAYRFGLLDIPNDRSSHNLPTPRGGGVGILFAFVASSIILHLHHLIWLPAAFLSMVSFFDDKLDLSHRTRLLFQFASAIIVVIYAFGLTDILSIHNPTSIIQNLMMLLLSSIVIVGTANFYNFMDGINGIAGITGAVAFALIALFARQNSNIPSIELSAFCISIACIGFLPFNMPKARVFMGDVGSILLGFLFAVYLVILSRTVSDFLVLAGFLSTFYADTMTTLFIRKRDGERLSQAHRRHLYQLFANQKKVEHWKVSTVYALIQGVIGISLLLLQQSGWYLIAVFELVIMAVWWKQMQRVRKNVEF